MPNVKKVRQRKHLRLHFSKEEQKTIEHTIDPLYQPLHFGRPTKALPGSDAKIRVLVKRLERGQELWHPKDPDCFGQYTQTQKFNFVRSKNEPRMIDRDTYGEGYSRGTSIKE